MPRWRRRGGTSAPCSGADTTAPPIRIVTALGCSKPATQRKVVVLPHPDGPSSVTISPAVTAKLTSSTAGLPVAKTLRKRSTRNSADIIDLLRIGGRREGRPAASLPVAVGLVPVFHPARLELLVLVEIPHPPPHPLWIVAFGIGRWLFQRGDVAEFLDHEGLSLRREVPIEEQPGGVRMSGSLRDAA